MNKDRVDTLITDGVIDISVLMFRTQYGFMSETFEYNRLLIVTCLYKHNIINYEKYKSMLQRLYFQNTSSWYYGDLKFRHRKGNTYHCSITDNYYDKCDTYESLNKEYYNLLKFYNKYTITIKDLFNAIKLISGRKDVTVKYMLVYILSEYIKYEFQHSNRRENLIQLLLDMGIDEKIIYDYPKYNGYNMCQCEYCGRDLWGENEYIINDVNRMIDMLTDYYGV